LFPNQVGDPFSQRSRLPLSGFGAPQSSKNIPKLQKQSGKTALQSPNLSVKAKK
jgi:hypothetical protein